MRVKYKILFLLCLCRLVLGRKSERKEARRRTRKDLEMETGSPLPTPRGRTPVGYPHHVQCVPAHTYTPAASYLPPGPSLHLPHPCSLPVLLLFPFPSYQVQSSPLLYPQRRGSSGRLPWIPHLSPLFLCTARTPVWGLTCV